MTQVEQIAEHINMEKKSQFELLKQQYAKLDRDYESLRIRNEILYTEFRNMAFTILSEIKDFLSVYSLINLRMEKEENGCYILKFTKAYGNESNDIELDIDVYPNEPNENIPDVRISFSSLKENSQSKRFLKAMKEHFASQLDPEFAELELYVIESSFSESLGKLKEIIEYKL